MSEVYRLQKKRKNFTKHRYIVYYREVGNPSMNWQGSHRFLWSAKFDVWGLLHFGQGILEVWVEDQKAK